jgi:hypothetical protein
MTPPTPHPLQAAHDTPPPHHHRRLLMSRPANVARAVNLRPVHLERLAFLRESGRAAGAQLRQVLTMTRSEARARPPARPRTWRLWGLGCGMPGGGGLRCGAADSTHPPMMSCCCLPSPSPPSPRRPPPPPLPPSSSPPALSLPPSSTHTPTHPLRRRLPAPLPQIRRLACSPPGQAGRRHHRPCGQQAWQPAAGGGRGGWRGAPRAPGTPAAAWCSGVTVCAGGVHAPGEGGCG